MSNTAPEPNRASSSGRERRWIARSALSVAILLLISGAISGCGSDPTANPLLRRPLLSIEAPAFTRFLARAARLEGTPIAREARIVLDRIEDCSEVWADFDVAGDTAVYSAIHSAVEAVRDGSDSETHPSDPSSFDCRDERRLDPNLRTLVAEHRGDHAGLLLWPLGDDGRLEITLDVDGDGGLEIDGSFVPPTQPGAFALLIPGEDEPEPAVLTPSRTLLHLRMKPADGIRLSNLIPAESQADRLFALKGQLLEGALLSGTWEFAFVAPAEAGQVPLAVGALHHRMAGPIEQALAQTLDRLEHTWPIHRSPRSFSLADGTRLEGGCFVDLPLLPELAPCWVVTPHALIIGYRGEAIDAALAPPGVSGDVAALPDFANENGLEIDLARFTDVDERIAPDERRTRPGDLYSKLEVRLRADESGRVALLGQLRAIP